MIPVRKIGELAGLGCTNLEIATLCELHVDTITNNYSDILAKGREMGKRRLRMLQWHSARRGSVAMQIWLGKQYLDQRDKSEVTQPDDPLKALIEEFQKCYEKIKEPDAAT